MDLEGDDIITQKLQSLVPAPMRPRIPPPVIVELQGRMQHYAAGETLTAFFPPQPRFTNVAGGVQGGILTAGLDAVMGCLAFLECGAPCTSLTIESSFVRAVRPEDGDFKIRAYFLARTKSLAFLRGEVLGPNDEICVTSAMTMMILDPDRLAKNYA